MTLVLVIMELRSSAIFKVFVTVILRAIYNYYNKLLRKDSIDLSTVVAAVALIIALRRVL
jgi:hypothetical protein